MDPIVEAAAVDRRSSCVCMGTLKRNPRAVKIRAITEGPIRKRSPTLVDGKHFKINTRDSSDVEKCDN